jgi:DNA-binding CsgD family transcriptional regulator
MITMTEVPDKTADEGLVEPDVISLADGAAAVDRLLASARKGRGGWVVLACGPSSGGTALLDESVHEASDMRCVRVSGIESERTFAFAAVHQLLVPFLTRIQRLPTPQRDVLAALAGLAKGSNVDRLLIGLAVLTLLVDASEDQPVLVAVNDAQWLDRESAEVLAFVARRLRPHRLAFVLTTHTPAVPRIPFVRPPASRSALPATGMHGNEPGPMSPPCPIPQSVTAAQAPGLVRMDEEVGSPHPVLGSAVHRRAGVEGPDRIGAAIVGTASSGSAMHVRTRLQGEPQAVPGDLTTSLRDGLALRGSQGYSAAVPIMRPAVAAILAGDGVPGEAQVDLFGLATLAAGDLLDADAQRTLAHRWVQLARDLGDGQALAAALGAQARTEILAGRLDEAEACLGEGRALGPHWGAEWPSRGVELTIKAWRGLEEEAHAAAQLDGRAAPAQAALAVLDLAYGRYRQVVARAQDVYREDPADYGMQVLPDLVEAAARTGDRALAVAARDRLALRASVVRTPLALGLLTRTQALLTDDSEADGLYREATERLAGTVAAPHLARAHLLHGEWLRRRRRRRDARQHLRTAAEMFQAMGMNGFAQRAHVELRATGERVSRRTGEPDTQLTPRESQIAQLVSDGLANRDIATQLYLSPNTVEYHLQKVFRKLNLTSRTQLARALLTGAATSRPAG